MSRRVSSLPVVDNYGHFVNIVSKADVMVIHHMCLADYLRLSRSLFLSHYYLES